MLVVREKSLNSWNSEWRTGKWEPLRWTKALPEATPSSCSPSPRPTPTFAAQTGKLYLVDLAGSEKIAKTGLKARALMIKHKQKSDHVGHGNQCTYWREVHPHPLPRLQTYQIATRSIRWEFQNFSHRHLLSFTFQWLRNTLYIAVRESCQEHQKQCQGQQRVDSRRAQAADAADWSSSPHQRPTHFPFRALHSEAQLRGRRR